MRWHTASRHIAAMLMVLSIAALATGKTLWGIVALVEGVLFTNIMIYKKLGEVADVAE